MNKTRRWKEISRPGSTGACLRIALALAAMMSPSLLQAQAPLTCPPKTRVDNVSDRYGKTTVVDPYRWLEEQDSKETREGIEAQDRCTEAAISKLPGRQAIAKRLTELFRIDAYGLPKEFAGRYFFSKR